VLTTAARKLSAARAEKGSNKAVARILADASFLDILVIIDLWFVSSLTSGFVPKINVGLREVVDMETGGANAPAASEALVSIFSPCEILLRVCGTPLVCGSKRATRVKALW
jgi:hypothetical protein